MSLINSSTSESLLVDDVEGVVALEGAFKEILEQLDEDECCDILSDCRASLWIFLSLADWGAKSAAGLDNSDAVSAAEPCSSSSSSNSSGCFALPKTLVNIAQKGQSSQLVFYYDVTIQISHITIQILVYWFQLVPFILNQATISPLSKSLFFRSAVLASLAPLALCINRRKRLTSLLETMGPLLSILDKAIHMSIFSSMVTYIYTYIYIYINISIWLSAILIHIDLSFISLSYSPPVELNFNIFQWYVPKRWNKFQPTAIKPRHQPL